MKEDLTKNDVEFGKPELSEQTRASEAFGMFQTVSVAPTKEPINWFNQIQYYKNGATLRIYIYDSVAHVWSYATLT